MSAKLIFVVVAAVAAIGSAVLAGIITALAGLSAKVPTATLITLTTGSAAAAFGGVIALSSMAASILLNAPEPSGQKPSAISPAESRRTGSIHTAERDHAYGEAASDEELRAALESRALILQETQPAADAETPTLLDRKIPRPYQLFGQLTASFLDHCASTGVHSRCESATGVRCPARRALPRPSCRRASCPAT